MSRSTGPTPARASHRRALLPWALVATLGGGCAREVEPDRACQEAAYAIAGRTEQCTGDAALADARFTAFQQAFTCTEVPVESMGEDTASPISPEDRLHCAFAIRNLPCALVEEYGDDLERYMTASPMCATLVQPAGGAR